MAFVSGVGVKVAPGTAQVCKTSRAARTVMNNEKEDKQRGFNLFRRDIKEIALEKAPSKVVGATQDYSVDASIQPGEFGYRDPEREREDKMRPKPQFREPEVEEETATIKEAGSYEITVQPGEYGYRDPLEEKKKPAIKIAKATASEEEKVELPDWLDSSALPTEEEDDGLPDYLKPLPEDAARKNWNF